MKLIPVDSILRIKSNHKLQELIEEFMKVDADIVKVEFGVDDYKSPAVCRSSLAAAIKRSGYLIRVWRRGNNVFLSKGI